MRHFSGLRPDLDLERAWAGYDTDQGDEGIWGCASDVDGGVGPVNKSRTKRNLSTI